MLMKKAFPYITIGLSTILGITLIVQSILLFTNINSYVGPDWSKTTQGVISVIFGLLSLASAGVALYFVLKQRDVNNCNRFSLISLAIFLLSQGIGSFVAWFVYKNNPSADNLNVSVSLAVFIVSLVSAILIGLSAANFSLKLRKIFGIVGSVIGIAMFGLSCLGLAGAAVTTMILAIGGLAISIIGLLLSASLEDF